MQSLIILVDEIFKLYTYILLARIFLSWVNPDPYNPLVKFIYNVTEPVLKPFRVIIRTGNMGIDLSPIIAFFLLDLLRQFIINFLLSLVR